MAKKPTPARDLAAKYGVEGGSPAVLKAYKPTLRNKIAEFVGGDAPQGSLRRNFTDTLVGPAVGDADRMTLADMLGVGQLLSGQEGGRDITTPGQRLKGAAEIAMALIPGAPALKGAAKGAGKTAVKEAEKLAAKYGPKQVPDAVDMLAKKLRELGANPKIGKPYTTPYGTSVYLYPSEVINADTPHLRISDHSGGWGANRGPVKPGGFNLGTEMSEAELNAAIDAAISSPSGRAFWDADNLKADWDAAYQAAVDQSRATAPERALAYYIDNIRNGRKRAATGARSIYGNFEPPAPPAKPKAPDPTTQDLAAKYGLPEFTTDLTPAQIEANRAAHMAGAKSPPVLYHGTTQWEGDAYNPNRATVNRTGNNIAGFYADERPKRAESYALDWRTNDTEFGEGANVMPVHVAIKNPFIPGKTPVSQSMLDAYATELRASNRHLGSSGEDWVANKVRDAAQANHFSIGALNGDGMAYQRVVRAGGYDGLKDGTAWVAFEPTQIKSTMNRGTFDPNDPHISKARGGLIKKYGV